MLLALISALFYIAVGFFAFFQYNETVTALIDQDEESGYVTVSRCIREEMTTWAFLCSALSFFRIVIAACITHKFIHRGAGALWLLAAILAWISLLFTIASGVTLLLVVAYPANTYPREHAAAVVVFGASVVFARWTHIGSFYVFKTQHEEELASIMLRCAVACLVVDGCTLYTLNRNFELKTAEIELELSL